MKKFIYFIKCKSETREWTGIVKTEGPITCTADLKDIEDGVKKQEGEDLTLRDIHLLSEIEDGQPDGNA